MYTYVGTTPLYILLPPDGSILLQSKVKQKKKKASTSKEIHTGVHNSECPNWLKIMWSTCNLKKLDVNCCEIVNFRPYLSEKEILIYNYVVENSRAFLYSNLQRITEVHKTLTQIWICGIVLMVAVLAVSASLTDGGKISFQFQITQQFSTTEVNSSHIIVQIECTFSWKSNKMGIFQDDFSFFTSTPHYL